MDADSQRFYGGVLVVIWLFVLPDCMYGLSKQEYTWVEAYQGLSQRWIPDTEHCTDSSEITAHCTAR